MLRVSGSLDFPENAPNDFVRRITRSQCLYHAIMHTHSWFISCLDHGYPREEWVGKRDGANAPDDPPLPAFTGATAGTELPAVQCAASQGDDAL